MVQKKLKLFFLSTIIFCLLTLTAYAGSEFVVKKIQIQGLQGISQDTVLNYMPIKVGDHFDDKNSAKVIQELYKTGFFDNVALEQDGNTLVVKVVQRPIISQIKISGNKAISTDQLQKALKGLGFTEGNVFNPALLEGIKTSLKREYFVLGKYNADVNITTTKEPRNRVAVNVDISEGVVAKIHEIKIIGNHTFDENVLLKQFKLSTTGLLSFYTHDDQYSREKLEADLESLRSYYMDRGYLQFKIDSTQVSITPDHKQVYIVIHVTEGSQYKVSGYSLSGKLILPKEKIEQLVDLKQGQIFSRRDIVDIQKHITDALSDQGYANADIQVNPKVNEKDKTVFIDFTVVPGPRIYIRHVTFSDNFKTNEEVLRRSLVQFEGGVLSSNKVNESKRELLLLPYIRDVDVTTTPVSGVANQVDVNYKVSEQSAAELQAGVAYSEYQGFIITGSLTHRNVFGTGSSLSLGASNSEPETDVSFNYYNPYYTESGIGRSFGASATYFNAGKANVTDYITNTYHASMGYTFPVIQKDSVLNLGFGYENDYLDIENQPPTEAKKFVDQHGRHFYQAELTGGWSSVGFDRATFPTRGLYQNASALASVPLAKESLEYYTLGYNATYYHPIYQNFIGQLRGEADYGNGYGKYKDLPFFKNFYVGGIGSVRGYEANTLGPLDSNGNPIGGKFAVSGTAGLVVPNPVGQNVRTTVFVDTGNAYKKFELAMRYSAGLEVDWLSPIGMLNFSLAKPLNKHRGDQEEIFQFNVGASF